MHIYIPKRVYGRLKSIYAGGVTIVSGEDGCGKSTTLAEFIRRSRGKGRSCRFIRGSKSAEECFGKLCRLVTGTAQPIPATDGEERALRTLFERAELSNAVIIADDPYAWEMVLGGYRAGRLISECLKAPLVVTTAQIGEYQTMMARLFCYGVIEGGELLLSAEETEEYARQSGIDGETARAVFFLTGGMLAYVTAAFELVLHGRGLARTRGEILAQLVGLADARTLGAMFAAAAFERISEPFLRELCACGALTARFGEGFAAVERVEALHGAPFGLGLIRVDKKARRVFVHPCLKKALRESFGVLTDEERRQFHSAIARNYLRLDDPYMAFSHFFLSGDFDAAADCPRKPVGLSFNMLLRTSGTLARFMDACPLSCRAILPRYMRILALLTLTDRRGQAREGFTALIAAIKADVGYSPAERRRMLFAAELMRTYEDLFILEKMGTHIKRAYELFNGRRELYPPFHSWNLYAPSVFSLIHRYSLPLSTESEQFSRYHRMYSEMIDHGGHILELYMAECVYFTGNYARAGELCRRELESCSDPRDVSVKIALLSLEGRTALYGGDYARYAQACGRLSALTHLPQTEEAITMARLCLAALSCAQGEGRTDGFFLRCMSDRDITLNRFQAPFSYMIIALMDYAIGRYAPLLSCREKYLAAADAVRNETIYIKLLLLFAAAEISSGDEPAALRDTEAAFERLAGTGIYAPAAEIMALCPQLAGLAADGLPARFSVFANACAHLSFEYRRGIEAVKTYSLSGGGAASLKRTITAQMVDSRAAAFDEVRRSLGLSRREFAYAMLAASRFSNADICGVYAVGMDAVKSSLKRAFAKLGIRSRGQLRSLVPTIGL